jgi:hypothetical protein
MVGQLKKNKVLIQGIVTTAAVEYATSRILLSQSTGFKHSRYKRQKHCLTRQKKEAYHYELTSDVVNEGVLGIQQRFCRETTKIRQKK